MDSPFWVILPRYRHTDPNNNGTQRHSHPLPNNVNSAVYSQNRDYFSQRTRENVCASESRVGERNANPRRISLVFCYINYECTGNEIGSLYTVWNKNESYRQQRSASQWIHCDNEQKRHRSNTHRWCFRWAFLGVLLWMGARRHCRREQRPETLLELPLLPNLSKRSMLDGNGQETPLVISTYVCRRTSWETWRCRPVRRYWASSGRYRQSLWTETLSGAVRRDLCWGNVSI